MADSQKRSVLIADDDTEFLSILRIRLESMGLDVRTASSGKEALAEVIVRQPDLLCLDANMPAGDSFTVCEVLALDAEASRIPVIIITGRKDPETIKRCREMCAYYICKSNRLWEAIESVVYELLDVGSTTQAAEKQWERTQTK